jgi:hypothetical protein
MCLAKVPFVRVERIEREATKGEIKADLLVTLGVRERVRELLVEVKNNGQPRLAREAVNQLLRYRQTYPTAYGIFMAPYISPCAAEVCWQAGVGYVDLAGNCRLSFDEVYIDQQGNPNPFLERRDLRSLYSPRTTRVLRVILSDPKRAWKLQELANEARVSLGQASNVKKLLRDREWTRSEKTGFVLADPEQLLDEWAANYSYRKNQARDFYSLKSVAEIEADLGKLLGGKCVEYALTGFSGAARLLGAVRYMRAMAYVGDTEEDVASLLNLKEVKSGANVTLLTPYDDGVFYGTRAMEDIKIASPIQIYLDLLSFRGRGEETATEVLERVIRPSW